MVVGHEIGFVLGAGQAGKGEYSGDKSQETANQERVLAGVVLKLNFIFNFNHSAAGGSFPPVTGITLQCDVKLSREWGISTGDQKPSHTNKETNFPSGAKALSICGPWRHG
jgi:hypothetical protein